MAASPHTSDAPVKRRAVFYIPGYDPIHPRRYRELYRKEGAAQAEISGCELSLSARPSGAQYGWSVKGLIDGAHVDASVDVLVWSDIVRASMDTSIPATYLQLFQTAWVYIGSGALWRLMRLRKGPVIAALYPVGMLLVQLGLAILLGMFAARALDLLPLVFGPNPMHAFDAVKAIVWGGCVCLGIEVVQIQGRQVLCLLFDARLCLWRCDKRGEYTRA